jgi:type IV secretory pathway TrbD component
LPLRPWLHIGLIVFRAGLYLANLAGNAIEASRTSQARILAIGARAAIMVLAGAMALRELGVADEIITLAFGLTLGAIAVAVAMAFGIGGRDLAAQQLEQWHSAVRGDNK